MDVAGAWAQHLNPAFVRLLGVFGYGRVWTRADDVWMWDDQGRRYLDALAAFGAASVGHNHPRLVARVRGFFDDQPLGLCHTGPTRHAAALATDLAARLAPLTVSLLASGGAEAVEAAVKLAVAATGRSGLLYTTNGYHGTSVGTLALMGAPRMRAPFEALLADAVAVPYGEIGPVRDALASRRFAAFVVEPVQAEGGVVAPPDGWLADVAALCRKAGTLFVLDEIQSGLGRVGTFVDDVVPDVRVLGKALGGGLVPVSVAVTTPAWHAKAYGTMERFDLHSSTYGGGALGCVIATEALAILDGLTPTVAARGERLREGLRAALAGHPFVKDVRGRGLLVGVELGPASGLASRLAPGLVELLSKQVLGQWLAVRLLEAGVVAQPATLAWNVLRLEPPLTIADPEIDRIIAAVATVLNEVRSVPTLLADVTARMGEQAWRGGTFR
ncbi:MAG: aspartate aminotransferase family protein [Pseudomonadota bacterium]|nr:aspartate aminotransferase family protein [Pseudomonadota bacterium]